VEASSVYSDYNPCVWEEDVWLLKSLDIFKSAGNVSHELVKDLEEYLEFAMMPGFISVCSSLDLSSAAGNYCCRADLRGCSL
jgi:hypothetical protein